MERVGYVDMKGGVALALGLASWLAGRHPELFSELAILLVMDEEWRLEPFAHVERFAHYDACLCFEAGERPARRRASWFSARRPGRSRSTRAGGPPTRAPIPMPG